MGKINSYYKIEDAETLKQIEEFMDKHDQFFAAITAMCNRFGFENYSVSETIQNGIRFFGLLAHPDNDKIDTTLWKTSKHGSGYISLSPRATAKQHKAEYLAMCPKRFEYTELNKLILAEDVMPWSTAYGYTYKKGSHFMFETSLPVASVAIEILGSEYHGKFNRKVECEVS